MDGLDVDILRVMGLQPFLAWPHPPDSLRPGRIARELSVSAETVKDRIARMEASGVIAGYEIFPNLRHLGVSATTYHFRVDDAASKARGLQDVRNVDGVVGVFDYLGPTVCVDIAYRHPRELDRKVGLIARLLAASALPHPCFDYVLPPVPRPLGHLDWRIIRALRGRARRRPEDVADELGVSARTVRRRLERMAAEASVDVVPDVDASRMEGWIMYEVILALDEAAAPVETLRPRLTDMLRGALAAAWPEPSAGRRSVTLLLLARSVADIQAMRRDLERVPGVARAEVLIPAGTMARSEWIDEAIEARIAETEAARASGTTAASPRS